jgi:hypothetical protein
MDVGATQNLADVPQYARLQMMQTEEGRKQVRANASLPKQAWVGIEDAVYPAMDDVLTIVDDLRSRGLTVSESVDNKVAEWHKQDYEATATISMEPETESEEGNVEYDLDGAPLPLIHSDFSIGFRETGTAGGPPGGMAGQDIETLNAEGSARAVAEAMERLVLYGWEPTIGGDDLGGTQDGYTMYGLTNHPSVHTGTLGDWTTNPEVIRPNLKDGMARDLKDDNFRPTGEGYLAYVGEGLEDVLDDPDPEGTGDRLIRDRIENLNFIGDLRVSQFLEDDAVLMFRPTSDVVDLAIALEEQVVQWEDPFRDYFKTVSAMTPRVKDTLRGQCGIAYYTGGTQ